MGLVGRGKRTNAAREGGDYAAGGDGMGFVVVLEQCDGASRCEYLAGTHHVSVVAVLNWFGFG